MNIVLWPLCLSVFMLVAVQAMPMTSHVTNLRCKDKEGNTYPVGTQFTRTDGAQCTCSYIADRQVTRLSCRTGVEHRGSGRTGSGYDTSYRSLAATRCQYQGRYYALNSEWKMDVNGVLMDCTCDSTARLSCRSGRITSSSRSSNLHLGYNAVTDDADLKCQQSLFQADQYFAIQQAGGYYALCTCHGTTATCSVPTASGEDCKFPFDLAGRLYSTCTTQGDPTRKPFCATSRARIYPQVVADCITTIEELNQYYGYVFTHGGNSNGARCHFPFSVGSVQYHTCQTDESSGSRWCATTANYDADQKFGYCIGERASDAVYNALGETATLYCRYNKAATVQPVIKWYKLIGSRRQHIYTYDVATQTGTVAPTAGFYASRLSMPNANELQIANMQYGDTGTFECEASYPGITTTSQRTDVSIGSSPTNFKLTYVPRISQVTFKWTNPEAQIDGLRLEIQQEGSNAIGRVRLSPGVESHVIYRRFLPGETYTARIYAIIEGQDSIPATLTFMLPQLPARTIPGSSGETTLSAAQPLAAPRVQEDEIILNWFNEPLPDVQVTGWRIVYVDLGTEETNEVTLEPGTTTYSIEELQSGTVYRITLYAVVNGTEVEIASADATTESTPAELTGPVELGDVTETTVTLSWPAPEQAVTHYEVAYRDVTAPNSQWQKYRIRASSNPRVTERRLQPGTTYDFHITPITNNVRGVYTPITVTTPATRSRPTHLHAPTNLVVSDVTRSSFVANWEPAAGEEVDFYNVGIEPASYIMGDRPYKTVATHPVFYAGGLEGGRTYILTIVAVSGSVESPEVTETVTTVNEVCEVEGVWRAADEKFYKRNPRGYMQNCTCFRKIRGGRWRCEPIICLVDGVQHTVNETWRRPAADGRTLEDCTCTLMRDITCISTGETIPERPAGVVHQSVGGRLVLRCPHETTSPTRPTIEWSKIVDGAEQLLYVYHGPQTYGHEERTAGDMSGRISMDNEVEFVVEPVRASDGGTYECKVLYPGIAPSVHLTSISVTPTITDRSDTSLLFIPSTPQVFQTDGDFVTITWEVPPQEATSYIVKYTDITNNGREHIVTVNNPTVQIADLLPSTRYRVTVIPVLNGARGEPINFELTTQAATPVTEAPVTAPSQPTNLRFDSKGRTTVTARWTPPFDVNPVDSYRVEYKRNGTREAPTSYDTVQRYLRVVNLEPGQSYVFKVYAVRDGLESVPNVRDVFTEPIGRILVQASNPRRSNRVGSTATLYCRYDTTTPGQPVVTWYKLDGAEPGIIYTYDTSTGRQQIESSNFAGRLSSSDASRLDISNLQGSDHGNYECRVMYPTGGGNGRTPVVISGPPGPVTFTSPVDGPEESTHVLEWEVEPNPQPEGFELQVRRRGATSPTYTTFNVPRGSRSFLFRGLRPGQTYEGFMTSQNRYGRSEPTQFYFTTSTSDRPNPPTNLRVVNPSANEVTIVVQGPSNVDFYRIRYSPETPIPGVPEKVAEGTSPTDQITLTELVPNTPYIISATSVEDNVESEPFRAKMTTPKRRPPTPTDVTIIEVQPRRITFEIVGSRTGVDQYEIRYVPTIGGTEKIYRANPLDNRVTLTVEPDVQYEMTIRALNREGGESALLRTVFTTPPEQSPPARPLFFSVLEPTSDSVTLRWTGSTDNVQYYAISYRLREDTVAALRETPGIQQTMVIPGLLPDSDYYVSVTAVGSGGHSPKLEGQFRTLPLVPLSESDVTEVGTFPDEVTIFLNPDQDVDYYIVRYRPEGEVEETETIIVGPNITLTNLVPTTRYLVTLIAVKDNVESVPIETTVETQPDQPEDTGFTVDNIQSVGRLPDEVTFHMNPNDQADYYIIRYRLEDEDDFTELVLTGPDLTIDHLQPGSRYVVELIMVDDNIESQPVVNVVETPVATPTSTQPSQPTGLRELGKSSTSINFLIESPIDHVEYFHAEWNPVREPGNVRERDNPSNDLTISGLAPSTVYELRVVAVYNELESLPVATTFRTSPEEAPIVGSIAPTNLRVTRVGPNQATLEWVQPGNPDAVARYIFSYRETARDYLPVTRKHVAATTPYTTLTHLVPDTQYTVNLTAIGRNRQRPTVTTSFRTTPEPVTEPSSTRPTVVVRTQPASPEPIPTDEPEPLPLPLESPHSLVVTRRGDNDADVTWEPRGDIEEIDGFLVEFEPTFTRHGPAERVELPNSATETNLPSLIPGTEYQVRVFATRGDQQSAPALATFITQLQAPNNLVGIPQTDRVTISWENPEGDLLGTRFETRRPGQSWRERIFNPDTTRHVVPISPDDEQLEVRITSLGRTIQSPPAETIVIIRAPGDVILGEPIAVEEITGYEGVVTLSDDVVPSNGWILRVEDEEGIVGIPILLTDTATTYNLVDLQPGKKYTIIALTPEGGEIGRTDFTTKADSPRNIQTVQVAPNTATVSWQKPHSDITGYVVHRYPVGGEGDVTEVELTPDTTEYQFTGLVPETLYEITISPTFNDTSKNESKELGMSVVHRFTTTPEEPEPTPPNTPPQPATDIRFTDVEPDKVTANWSPSPNVDVDTHRVELSRVDDGSLVVSSNLPTSYALFTRLEPDTLYEVVVTAVRGIQESSPLVGRVYTGTNAPSSVDITDVVDNGFTVTWEPETPENPLLVEYFVSVQERDSDTPAINYTFPAYVTSASLDDLKPGTPYEVSVTSILDGVATIPVTTTTTTEVPNPTGVSFGGVTETTMTVTWETPNGEINDFVVDYWPTGNPDSRRLRVKNITQATLGHLNPGSNYTVSVHSVQNGRMSDGVVETHSTNSLVGPPEDLQTEYLTDTSVVVTWEPFDDQLQHRIVLSSPLLPGGSSETYLQPGEHRFEFEDLQPGSTYRVVVTSVPTTGTRMRQSMPLFFTTKPTRPTNLRSTQSSHNHLVMEWDHDQVSRFLVTYQPEVGGLIGEQQTTTNRAVIPYLEPETLYVITVQAVIPDEVFSEAAVKSEWTDRAPPTALPTNVNVDHTPRSGLNSYLVTWELPQGSDDSYTILFYPVGEENSTSSFITPPGSTSHTLTGLHPGVEYSITIYPGEGEPTGDVITRTFFTVVPRPTEVTLKDVTETSLVVEWDAEPLDEVTYYTAKVFPMGHPNSAITERVSSFLPFAYAFTGLEPGRNYQVDVTAHTDVTSSAPTTAYVTTTMEGPNNVNTRVTSDQAVVRWHGTRDADRYRITLRPSNQLTASQNPVFTDAPVTTYTFTDLQPNTEYLIDIVAMNLYRQIESRPTQAAFTTLATTIPVTTTPTITIPIRTIPATTIPIRTRPATNIPVRTRPTPVQPVGASTTQQTPEPLDSNPINETSYSIKWNAPTEAVRFYKVISVSGSGQRNQINVPSYQTNLLLQNLVPNNDYTVTVHAVLRDGREVQVGSTELTTFSTDRSATIEWDLTSLSYESFRITATPVRKNSPATEQVFTDISPIDTHAWLTGLYPGTRYRVLIEGLISDVYYPVDEMTITTDVDAPSDLKVSKLRPNGFTLRWTPPLAKITRYSLTYQLNGEGPEMTNPQTPGAKATRSHVKGLQPGSRYLIRLYARNKDGDSPPAMTWVQTLEAPTGTVITSDNSEPTEGGVLVRWQSAARYVQNWKVVVEPQDGSDGYETTLRRDDKRHELRNLRHGVAYIVKIYPNYGESLYGEPRIIHIPASTTQGITVNTFPWHLRVPRVRSDGVTLMWNRPWFQVEEYVLYIKQQSEPDSAFREVSPQPIPGQNMATINNLEPGERYTLRLNATSYDSVGQRNLVSTITLNFTTLLPEITGVQIRSLEDGSIVLTWHETQGLDHFVVKYREDDNDFVTRTLNSSSTTYTIPSPTPGTTYEIQFYAERGAARSHILVFTIDVPEPLPANCRDLETGAEYNVGDSWNTVSGDFRLRCTCHAPQQYNCDTAEWCHADGQVYDPGQTWTRVRGFNLRESCTCRGRNGYNCEPTNCHDQLRGYDEGETWVSAIGNVATQCECQCAQSSTGHRLCQSVCQQPFGATNEQAKR